MNAKTAPILLVIVALMVAAALWVYDRRLRADLVAWAQIARMK